MHCREQMDRASAKLGRARSSLSLAIKAGTEASLGELLDAISSALEQIDAADLALAEDERRGNRPGHDAPGLEAAHPRLVVAATSSAS